ncbi:MAG: MmpS family protein [Treponema sp.]|nr:MmpS family protein [Treponema sp.]
MRTFFLFPVTLLFCLALPPLPAAESPAAETGLSPEIGAGLPLESLERLLERDMGGRKKTWGLRFKNQEEESPLPKIEIPWMRFFQEAGALILRGGLILVIAAVALACGIYVYRHRGGFPRESRPPAAFNPQSPPKPAEPARLLEEAGDSYRRGRVREAWGLCYAASLGALGRSHGFRFPPGATEYRCLALFRSRQNRSPLAAGPRPETAFAELIRHWVALAYGGSLPPEGAFEESLAWVASLDEGAGHE